MKHASRLAYVLLFFYSSSAAAQTRPRPESIYDKVEDLYRDHSDDFDAEDIAALPALPRKNEIRLPPTFRISLVGWYEPLSASRSDRGAAAVLTVAWGHQQAGPKPIVPVDRAEPALLRVASVSDLPEPSSLCFGRPTSRLSASEIRVLVLAALRSAGLITGELRLDDLASRARWASLLPELRLRGVRNNDQTLRLSPVDGEPYRTLASGGASMLWEARVSWRLDRLTYADDETSMERQRAELRQQRYRVTVNVIEQVAAWQKAHSKTCDARSTDEERSDASAHEMAAETMLDGLTEGAWSKKKAR